MKNRRRRNTITIWRKNSVININDLNKNTFRNSPSLTFLLKVAARVVMILVRTAVTPPNAAFLSAFNILCTASAIIFNIISFSKGFVISESFSVLMRCFTAYNFRTTNLQYFMQLILMSKHAKLMASRVPLAIRCATHHKICCMEITKTFL